MDTTNEKLLPPAHEPKLLESGQAKRHKASGRKLVLLGLGLLVLMAVLFFAGYLPRHKRRQSVEAAADREASSLPTVNVAKVRRSPPVSNLLLPGNITPITEAYLYARASGYVKRRYADIGDRVRAGQLLAEIESPELDQQVAQGRAALAQAEQQLGQANANLTNARAQEELQRVTWERYRPLVEHGALSKQAGDQQLATFRSAAATVGSSESAVRAAEENVRAARANLDRLIALQGFEKVTAPFSGVVTARNFDVGALIGTGGAQGGGAGNAGTGVGGGGVGAGGELFRVAQIDTLRVLVNVPQESAPTIRVGQPATVTVQEFSKQPFQGKVTRTANALDAATRTLLTEVQVANPRRILFPGMYTQVQFADTRTNPTLLIPGDSLIAGADGLRVAILRDLPQQQRDRLAGEGGGSDATRKQARQIHLQTVEVGRDYGPQIEVTGGLEGWEYVAVNPSDVVQEGAIVIPRNAPETLGAGAPERRGPSDRSPSGISTPSQAAPRRGAETSGKGGRH